MKISHKNLMAAMIIVGMLAPISVYAVDVSSTYVPLAPLPCVTGNATTSGCVVGATTFAKGVPMTTVDVNSYVQYAFNLLIALAAVAAVFMITWGGFEYMTSVAPGSKSDGLGKVKNAVYGLLLVLCSFLILKAINPQFVQVPVGLVAPLNLCATNPSLCTNTLNTWAQQLQNQQAIFDAQQIADQQQISSLANTNNALQKDASNIATSIYETIVSKYGDISEENVTQACTDYSSDPDVATLCKQWQSNQTSIQNNINAGTILNTEKTFSSYAAGATKTANAAQTLSGLQSAYTTAYTKLQSSGATQTQLQSLANTYLNTDGQVRLIDVGNNTTGTFFQAASVISDFKTIVNTDIPQITDSAAATTLSQSTGQAMDQFAAKYYPTTASSVKSATTPQAKLTILKSLSGVY